MQGIVCQLYLKKALLHKAIQIINVHNNHPGCSLEGGDCWTPPTAHRDFLIQRVCDLTDMFLVILIWLPRIV